MKSSGVQEASGYVAAPPAWWLFSLMVVSNLT